MNSQRVTAILLLIAALALGGCGARARADTPAPLSAAYTLRTGLVDGRMAFVGVGGAIDGLVNPDLPAPPGGRIALTLVNGDGIAHDLAVEGWAARTPLLTGKGATAQLLLEAPPGGPARRAYFCSVSGHRQAGMAGALVMGAGGE